MKQVVVSVDSVRKRYGDSEAVRGISFSVRAGEIAGLIGPNGAGKTTVIRMISTLIKPNAGSINVCGFDVVRSPREVRSLIGVFPEAAGLYERLTVFQNLMFYSSFYALTDRGRRIQDYLEMFDIAERKQVPVGKLSRGMKEKVQFIRAVVHDPAVILLDEPMTGLDPDARATLKGLLGKFGEQGKAILLSSHTLSDVESVCDRVVMIDAGELVVDDQIGSLKERFSAGKLPTLEEVYLSIRRRK